MGTTGRFGGGGHGLTGPKHICKFFLKTFCSVNLKFHSISYHNHQGLMRLNFIQHHYLLKK